MKDEEYFLITDTSEKKNVARSARSRRTHTGKGGKVRFPSDYMTKKELKEMNGDCKTYRMNSPISWDEFREMPDDLKGTYMKLLRNKFNVPDKYVAEMFHICRDYFSRYCIEHGVPRKESGSRSAWDKEGWYSWLNVTTDMNVEPRKHSVEVDEQQNEPEVTEVTEVTEESIAEVKKEVEELNETSEELHKNNEKVWMEKLEQEASYWMNRCKQLERNIEILEAQLKIVYRIFPENR